MWIFTGHTQLPQSFQLLWELPATQCSIDYWATRYRPADFCFYFFIWRNSCHFSSIALHFRFQSQSQLLHLLLATFLHRHRLLHYNNSRGLLSLYSQIANTLLFTTDIFILLEYIISLYLDIYWCCISSITFQYTLLNTHTTLSFSFSLTHIAFMITFLSHFSFPDTRYYFHCHTD